MPEDSKAIAGWRRRMKTDEAKEIYKERAATAECVNAQARNRGLTRLLVGGLREVKAVAPWFAIADNVATWKVSALLTTRQATCKGGKGTTPLRAIARVG